jgi:hypothetical protein
MSRKTLIQIATSIAVIFVGVAKNVGIEINEAEFMKTSAAFLVPLLTWVFIRKNTDKLKPNDKSKARWQAKWLSRDFLTVALGGVASILNALSINIPEWIIPMVVTALMGVFLKKEADEAKAVYK